MSFKVVVNHAEVKEFNPLKVGVNEVVISSVTIVDGKDGGDDQLKLTYLGAEESNEGRQLTDFTPLRQSMMWKFQLLFKICGIEDGYEFDFYIQEDLDLLMGKKMIAVVVEESYTDKDGNAARINKVKTVRSIDGSNHRDVPADSSSAVYSEKKNNKSDDDIPF